MKLKAAREMKDLSQESVSRAVNISLRHYQNIESGINIPAVNIAHHICEVLQIDPREIDEWKDRRPSV